MTNALTFHVYGAPAPQGSKKHVGNGILIESSKALKPWRADITAAAIDALTTNPHTFARAPLHVRLTFTVRRPTGHYRTGRNHEQLRPAAPRYPTTRPDIDKLARAVLDALTTAAVYNDDSQVVELVLAKRYPDDTWDTDALDRPGVRITIREAT